MTKDEICIEKMTLDEFCMKKNFKQDKLQQTRQSDYFCQICKWSLKCLKTPIFYETRKMTHMSTY